MTTRSLLDQPLKTGRHRSPEEGVCVIEWLRLHEGQDFSDDCLPCQSPVIHSFLLRVNDCCPYNIRQQLKSVALKSLGTANKRKEQRRAYRLVDVACREWAPLALECRGYVKRAEELRALPSVRTKATAKRADSACRAIATIDAADAAYAAAATANAANAAYTAPTAPTTAAAYAAYTAFTIAAAASTSTYAPADAVYAAYTAFAAAYAPADAVYAAYAAADAAVNAFTDAADAAAIWQRAIKVAEELCKL